MRKAYTYYKINPDIINWDDFCETYNKIADLQEETDDLQVILTPLGILADELFIYDKITKSMGRYIDDINQVLNENKYDGVEFSLSKDDLINQFTYSSNQSEVENVANAMYLANALARTIRDNKEDLENNANVGLTSEQLDTIKMAFYTIKEQCLRRLINIRNGLGDNPQDNDKKLLIQFAYTKNTDSGMYFVHIPGYLEPFVLQCQEVDSKELSYYDNVAFYETEGDYLPSKVPIKIKGSKMNQKETALFKFAQYTIRGYKKAPERVVNGVDAYFKMQIEYGDVRARFIEIKKELIYTNLEIMMIQDKGVRKKQ